MASYEKIQGLRSITGILSDAKLTSDVTGRPVIDLLFGTSFSTTESIFTIEYRWPTQDDRTDTFFLIQLQKIVAGCGGTDIPLDFKFIQTRISEWQAMNKTPVLWMQETVKFKYSYFIKPKDRYINYIKYPWQAKKLKINGEAMSGELGTYFSNLQAIGSKSPKPQVLVVDALVEQWGSNGKQWPKYIWNRFELLVLSYGAQVTDLKMSGAYRKTFLKEIETLVV